MNVNPNIPLVDICDLARELPRRDAKMLSVFSEWESCELRSHWSG